MDQDAWREPFERRVIDAIAERFAITLPECTTPLQLDAVGRQGSYPDTVMVVRFHRKAEPSKPLAWSARLWNWEDDLLAHLWRSDPAYLASFFANNLEEIFESDLEDDVEYLERDGLTWVVVPEQLPKPGEDGSPRS